jgi:hypothetical protein
LGPHRFSTWSLTKLRDLPTYGSWLNWLEGEFAALRYFALNGTVHRSHPAERRDRRLCRLAQQPSPTHGQFRGQLTDPILDRLPGQGHGLVDCSSCHDPCHAEDRRR